MKKTLQIPKDGTKMLEYVQQLKLKLRRVSYYFNKKLNGR